MKRKSKKELLSSKKRPAPGPKLSNTEKKKMRQIKAKAEFEIDELEETEDMPDLERDMYCMECSSDSSDDSDVRKYFLRSVGKYFLFVE